MNAPSRWGVFDVVEAMHLAHALAALQDLGVLAALAQPRTVTALAKKFGLEPTVLEATLQFVAARCDLVERRNGGFRASALYTPAACFQLELYAGAFATPAHRLAALLRNAAPARNTIDRRRHAAAFAYAPPHTSPVAALARQLDLQPVLDLGCGPGQLLVTLAAQDRRLRAWGIDANPTMCRLARSRLRQIGAGRRVRVVRGDSRRIGAVLAQHDRDSIRLLVAGDLANEWSSTGSSVLIEWLCDLRALFPQRIMLLSDYYGRLGTRKRTNRATLLHDYVQVISGQGVPAPDRAAWQTIYRRANCRMVHCMEDRTTTRFIHVIAL